MFRTLLVTSLVDGALATKSLTQKFEDWVQTYHKDYDDEVTRAIAFKNFVKTDEEIAAHNAKGKSWFLVHNEFSDWTWEQFASARLGYLGEVDNLGSVDYSLMNRTNLASSIDWVAKGAVTGVKNQGSCGSCWTFSTTGAIEGAYFVASGHLLSLSEQEITSCSSTGGYGCRGGWPYKAIQWVESNPLCLESDYPYTSGWGSTGTCKRSCRGVVKTGGYRMVPQDENSLAAALNKGPVSITIEADRSAFKSYGGGILDNSACGTKKDHAVLLVAYGNEGGRDYWKIKNSWGTRWGEGGYVRFIRGRNQCGINGGACYPTGVAAVGPGPSPGPSPTPGKQCWFDFCCPSGQKCIKSNILLPGKCEAAAEDIVV